MIIDLSGENKNIEYKREIPKKHKSLLKDIIAFANTTGGKVIIGVEDKTHSVYGVDPNEVEELSDNITNMVYDNCSPILYTNIITTALDDKNVIVIDVPAGKNRPYYLTSEGKEKSSYIRINGTSRPADELKLKELEMENYHISFDKLQYIGESFNENEALQLCHDLKEFALENAKTKEERERVKDLTILKLVDMGLLGKIGDDYYPTNAYNLMTKNNFDQAIIQCALFKGLTRGVFIDKKVFSGPLYKQIDEAYQFVLRNINYSFEIDGIRRRDNYEIPQESIRESIINAVCHRSYLSEACVQISIFDDRVEILSPGMLYQGMSIENMKLGSSVLRNKAIGKTFLYLNLIEQWGTGVPRILRQCEEFGLKEPCFEEFGTSFKVTLFRNNKYNNLIKDASNDYYDSNFASFDAKYDASTLLIQQLHENNVSQTNIDRICQIYIYVTTPFGEKDIVEICHCSRATATRIIRLLNELKLIAKVSRGKYKFVEI